MFLSSLFVSLAFLSPQYPETATALVAPWSYPVASETAQGDEIDPKQELYALSDKIALEHGISTTTLHNLVTSASQWNKDAESPTGDCGLTQLNTKWTGIPCDKAKDPIVALTYASEQIAKGREWLWSECSCVSQVRIFVPTLPHMDAYYFKPNSDLDNAKVAIYRYGTLSHIGYIEKVEKNGWWERGTNITPCQTYRRFIAFDSPEVKKYLVGFWKPLPVPDSTNLASKK